MKVDRASNEKKEKAQKGLLRCRESASCSIKAHNRE